MPDWFYPLMLVVALAGCAFLFVQGRSTSRVLDAMRRRLDTIEATLREGSTRAMPEVAELASAASDPDARTLDDLQGLLAEQATVIDRLTETLDRVEARLDASPTEAGGPEDVARAYLVTEGYTSIRILGCSEIPEGTRIQVGGLRGDEVRHGHVIVANGGVVDATLEVPTTLFP
jgi:uncharacterized coiled-coil protein SlyX